MIHIKRPLQRDDELQEHDGLAWLVIRDGDDRFVAAVPDGRNAKKFADEIVRVMNGRQEPASRLFGLVRRLLGMP